MRTVSEWGRLDVLVNNVGVLQDRMSFSMDEAEFDQVVRVNLKGHFAPSRSQPLTGGLHTRLAGGRVARSSTPRRKLGSTALPDKSTMSLRRRGLRA